MNTELLIKDQTYQPQNGVGVIYLAGGCFWGMERLMQVIPGVVGTTCGYANGITTSPTYKAVCSGTTSARETVRVEYQKDQVSLDALLFMFFKVIDPTVKDQQGHDVGSQYQTGIYYIDEEAKKIIERIITVEKKRTQPFYVEIKSLENFYDAEDYHQDYLIKNPQGYCHINLQEINTAKQMIVDPGQYPKPEADKIKKALNDKQYQVTQANATEAPFNNEYFQNMEKGIYVDIVTGEPLFTSKDKYLSNCGWPSFARSFDDNTLVYKNDKTAGMLRTEVRSRSGDSHLGHVFTNDPESPSKTRYCINSAALRFIPLAEMEAKGYGYLISMI